MPENKNPQFDRDMNKPDIEKERQPQQPQRLPEDLPGKTGQGTEFPSEKKSEQDQDVDVRK